ncbi:MAG: hypothetical protein HY397_02415 [Candidatus Doudnabacteria bacterium]|nr:hypothetical protein [Candidatus Doudnabacteria bacterium]
MSSTEGARGLTLGSVLVFAGAVAVFVQVILPKVQEFIHWLNTVVK